jgi:hypothetical protein
MAEPIVRMNLNNWDYFNPIGNRRFNKKIAKESAHVERHRYFFVYEDNKPPRLVKRAKRH